MNRKAAVFSLLSMVAGAVAKGPYRHFVYNRSVRDFGLADSLPSFFFVAAIVLFGLSLQRYSRQPPVTTTIALITGSLLYELEQRWLPGRTFDWKDTVAVVLGGLIAYYVYGTALDRNWRSHQP